MDMDFAQNQVSAECRRRWPDVNVMREALALTEEVGEIARCIVKRDEGTRGTADEWTERLRLEIGQAMGILFTVAALEGFLASDCFELAMQAFIAKPEREGMNLDAD